MPELEKPPEGPPFSSPDPAWRNALAGPAAFLNTTRLLRQQPPGPPSPSPPLPRLPSRLRSLVLPCRCPVLDLILCALLTPPRGGRYTRDHRLRVGSAGAAPLTPPQLLLRPWGSRVGGRRMKLNGPLKGHRVEPRLGPPRGGRCRREDCLRAGSAGDAPSPHTHSRNPYSGLGGGAEG